MRSPFVCLLLAVILPGLSSTAFAQDRLAPLPTRTVAVTFDDLPASGGPGGLPCDRDRVLDLTDRLLAHLAAQEVPAIGFVNEGRDCEDVVTAVLTRWLDAGHDLGNHTATHIDINNVPIAAYLDNIAQGEIITRRLLGARGRALRYFRHPYLHAGDTAEKKEAVEAFLAERGVRIAPVTLDNSEWIFAHAYSIALTRGDMDAAARIRATYLDWFETVFTHFEAWSLDVLGYEPPQVLLLHANLLNADAFGGLAERMKSRGYRFVTLDEAMADPAYDQPDPYIGEWGISWLHRWARGQGLEVEWEPDAPDWVNAYRTE
ncbi:MAG: polysaccharide deacetylase family protein [Rhodothermaceae bacterium]|nr:polysaccharide deacetylase family protein [Rhodothermaceae bacterium]